MSPQWDAADYAGHSRGQFGWALSVIDRLGLAGHERVLDVGCGDGKVSAAIAARLPRGRVVGVDRSAEMIDLAARTWTRSGGNLSFFVRDAQALDLAAEFDVAFSNAAIHWMGELPAVLRGIAGALESGGRAFLSMGGRGTAPLVFEALERFQRDRRWSGYLAGTSAPYHFRGPEEFSSALANAGLRPSRVELVAKPLQHADRAALTGWLRTTWMWTTERMPDDVRVDFLEALTDEVAPGCARQSDGALLLPMVNLEAQAVKM
jgi:trans-aconitate methyltransferase